MVRKCSHCGHNGHNSRTCCSSTRGMDGGGGVKLFGVQLRLAASPLKKSFSMECLSCAYPFAPSSSPSSSTSSLGSVDEAAEKMANGCLSDGPGGRKQERKKGLSWTEEEHRQFLAGLEKLGKGDWRGISRNFVTTRTPTQVASHAQKYFLRQSSLNKKKRRSSLFDVVSTCEKAAHRTDSSKPGEEVHGPVLSLCTMASQTAPETAKIDVNSSIQEQETDHLPSSVGPDLELRISSSRLNQKISSPGNLYLGTIRVT